MKLKDIYRTCIDAGIEADPRDEAEVRRILKQAADEMEKLDDEEKPYFDTERLVNPYADTRIACGDPEMDVRGLITGVDMETSEVLLAERLREKGEAIDLVLAHHPEGPGFARLDQVMGMQADMWHAQGVGLGVADALIATRASEVRRRILPYNHYRAVQAAEALGFACMSCHTPADNAAGRFVQAHLDAEKPATLGGVVKALRGIPEYADAARKGYGPEIIQGSGARRPGRIVVGMTGGTEGPVEALERLRDSGVDTLVDMHFSEDLRKKAEELHVNLVVAGHVSSDTLGMNLVLDRIEPRGVQVRCVSGMVRVRRD
jgi:putative NIF3 family GTP cyclohydrolase 1 type 2